MKSYPSPALLTGFITFLVLIIYGHLGDMSGASQFIAETLNAGHVVLMGFFALICLTLIRSLPLVSRSRRIYQYLLAFSLTVVVGVILEAAQITSARNADINDIVRDAIGAASFLTFYARFDSALKDARKSWGLFSKLFLVIIPPLVVIIALIPVISLSSAYLNRNRSFPMLATFDSSWEKKFWTTANAKLEITQPPEDWAEADKSMVMMMTCQPTTRSGFAINHVYPDWSGYDFLRLQVYLKDSLPDMFYVQIEDAQFQGKIEDRQSFQGEIRPGHNLIEVPLDSTRLLLSGRPLNLHQIERVYFYMADTTGISRLYIDNIGLR